MPDDRLIHAALGHSSKINALTDFERWVWLMYKLTADDFGVMRFSALTLQEAADWLGAKPTRTVQRALQRVCDVGLIRTFEHQGRAYCYQGDWQTWQKMMFPRATRQPAPPRDTLDLNTQWLMTHHPYGGKLPGWQHPTLRKPSHKTDTKLPEPFHDSLPEPFHDSLPEPFHDSLPEPLQDSLPEPLQDYSRTTPGVSPGADTVPLPACVCVGVSGSVSGVKNTHVHARASDELAERAGRFCRETYPALYREHRKGAGYVSKPHVDFQEALELCRVFDDERLATVATAFLTTNHEFAEKGSRTISQFRALASWCDARLREKGL